MMSACSVADIDTVELLTRAADAARDAASEATGGPWQVVFADRVQSTEVDRPFVADCDSTMEENPDSDADQANARLIAASGPDHWRAVEALFRRALERHGPIRSGGYTICGTCDIQFTRNGCDALQDLRDFAEQVLQHLGDTE